MLTLNDVINEYFSIRKDGGTYFNPKNLDDIIDFKEFLYKKKYDPLFDVKKLEEITYISEEFENEPISDYVKRRYREFFKEDLKNESDFAMCSSAVEEFRKTNQTLTDAFNFLKRNPSILKFEKKEVGQGEFALYLLLPRSKKIDSKESKGDIEYLGFKYEIKRLLPGQKLIRFGTNLDLTSINNFNELKFTLERLLKSKEYKDGEIIQNLYRAYMAVVSFSKRKVTGQETDDFTGGSKASWTLDKLNKFYEFLEKIQKYVSEQKKEKSISSSTKKGKNFIFKANDIDKDIYFKIPFDDLKEVLEKGKKTTTLEKTEDQQDTEELVSFSDDVQRALDPFLKSYSNVETFGNVVVGEIKEVYQGSGVQIIIIDQQNNFLLNPVFKFNSINQNVRPQVTLLQ